MFQFNAALAESISNALQAMGVQTDIRSSDIEIPPDKDLGHFAFPCFKLSKQLRKSSVQIAEEIRRHINPPVFIKELNIQSGYLNFRVDENRYCELALQKTAPAFAGKREETILIEYSSPNIAKPFHIGHLMTTIIGDSLSRIYTKAGYKVERINHLGDYGTQFGKLICAYQYWGDDRALQKDPIAELLRIYVKFHEEAEKHSFLNDEARTCFLKLEQGNQEETVLWERFRALSLCEFEKIYKRLGVRFDSYAGESFYSGQIPQVIEQVRQAGLLEESDGAFVVRLDEYGMPPCIIMKSDGATIYATRDLAAAIYRRRHYRFSRCLYVVGQPQALHFQQVFRTLKLMGHDWSDQCEHVGYSHIRFAAGKLSTRSGNIVLLEDVLNKAVQMAFDRLSEEYTDQGSLRETAEVIGIGAVKYAFLKNSRERDILFDWDEIMDFQGDSAPYIQYTYARCKSISRKASAIAPSDGTAEYSESEFELIRLFSEEEQVIQSAVTQNAPSVIARYVYRLARAFNHFYHTCPVIGSPCEKQRVLITQKTAESIAEFLGLLGIGVVEHM